MNTRSDQLLCSCPICLVCRSKRIGYADARKLERENKMKMEKKMEKKEMGKMPAKKEMKHKDSKMADSEKKGHVNKKK
jgi:hypothetical protein